MNYQCAMRRWMTFFCLFWFIPRFAGLDVQLANAADRYVTPPGGYGTNNYPYTTWADAATNIQWAVGAATNGETVWVTNGNYVLTNQIVITNGITLKSVNGWTNTVVNGNYPNTTNRCIYALGSGVRRPVIDGFTITNGYAQSNDFSGEGGGVNVSYGDVFNCLITGNQTAPLTTNTAWHAGGGGGINLGSSGCTVLICIVRGNAASLGGGLRSRYNNYISNCVLSTNHSFGDGGALLDAGTVVNSLISNNWADGRSGGINANGVYITNCVFVGNRSIGSAGGAVDLQYAGTIDGCVISNNSCGYVGGGVYCAPNNSLRVIKNSIIVNNSAPSTGGGGGGGGIYAYSGIIRQCLIKNNRQTGPSDGGAGIYLKNFKNYHGSVDSCTIVSNTGAGRGGGIALEGTNNDYCVSNCVVWGNIAANVGGNDLTDISGPTNQLAFSYTCANYTNFAAGQGNITNDPSFVDFAGGNYHLAANSPCVNVGGNLDWMTNSVDLDGRQRIRYGTVDMGCYEYIFLNGIVTSIE